MKLKTKVAGILGLVVLLYLSLATILSAFIFDPLLTGFEQEYARWDLGRCLAALDRDIEGIQTLADEYARDDAACDFLMTKSPNYIDTNFSRSTFEGYDLDFVYFVNFNGEVIWRGVYDKDVKPGSLDAYLPPKKWPTTNPLLVAAAARQRTTGVNVEDGAIYLIAASPVFPSHLKGMPQGILVMGRLLDEHTLNKTRSLVNVDFVLMPAESDSLPKGSRKLESLVTLRMPFHAPQAGERPGPPDGPPPGSLPPSWPMMTGQSGMKPVCFQPGRETLFHVDGSNPKDLLVSTVIDDITGKPAVVLRAKFPRFFYFMGMGSAYMAFASIAGLGMIVSVMLLVFLHVIIVRPVMRLKQFAVNIGACHDLSIRFRVGRKRDEIGLLAVEFNRMLERLGRDERARSAAEDALRQSESRFRSLFEDSPVPLWEEDWSQAALFFTRLRAAGHEDIPAYLDNHPEDVLSILQMVRVIDANQAAVVLRGAVSKDDIMTTLDVLIAAEGLDGVRDEMNALARGLRHYRSEVKSAKLDGTRIDMDLSWVAPPGYEDTLSRVLVYTIDITERKRAEESLRRSEERLNEAQEIARLGNWEADITTGRMWWSRGLYGLIGLAPGSSTPSLTTFLDLLEDASREDALEAIDAAIMNGETFDRRVLLRAEPGRARHVHLRAQCRLDDVGAVIAMVGTAQDITREVKMIGALQKSEERFKLAMDATSDGLWDWDMREGSMYFSSRYLTMLGYEPGVLPETFDTWRNLMHEDDEHAILPRITQHLGEKDTRFEMEFRMRTLSGGYRWIMSRGKTVLRDSSGAPLRALGTHTDITERRQAEEMIRLTQFALDNAADRVHWIQPDGRHLYVNDAACQGLGYSRSELLALRWTDVDAEAAASGWNATWARLRSQRTVLYETTHHRRDGSSVPVEVAVSYLEFKGREYLFANSRDISEWKRIEQQILSAKEAAEQASAAKSEFLANMSHEIRTPLNGVLGMAEHLLQTELSESQRECVGTICTSGAALLTVINDILDFSKIEAGKMVIEDAPFDFLAAVEDVGQLLSARAEEKGVDLIIRYAPAAPRYLMGDAGRIRQILMNLVGNAVKFTPEGHVFIEVEGHPLTSDEFAMEVRVEDTGIGMSREALDTIFEKFTQVESHTARKFGGTGLGLAISRELVQMMGGVLSVTSMPGEGSVFSFTLAMQRAPHVEESRPDTPPLAGVRILVVDDNATNRRVLVENFNAWDVESGQTPSPFEALDLLREAVKIGKPFDVLLTDHLMPGMDGIHLAAAVAEDESLRDTMVMLCSSVSGLEAAVAAGAKIAAVLTKPVRASMLMDALVTALDLWRRHELHGPITPGLALYHDQDAARGGNLGVRYNARVLLVEDMLGNQKVAQVVLGQLGCAVTIASNGQEALDQLRDHGFDIIFMDCQMPVMDGYEATGRIRCMEADGGLTRGAIVAMTANAMKGDEEKCLAAGMDAYIAKPISREAVQAVLRRFCAPLEERYAATISRALIVHDDPAVSQRIREVVRHVYPHAAIREAVDGMEACLMLGGFMPGLLVAGLELPDMSGLDILQRIEGRQRFHALRTVLIGSPPEGAHLPGSDMLLGFVAEEGIESGLRALLDAAQHQEKPEHHPEPHDTAASPGDAAHAKEASPVLDLEPVRRTIGDDPDTIAEFAAITLEDIQPQLVALQEALENGALDAVQRAAHAIKGSAAGIGAMRLKETAYDIEQAARHNDAVRCATLAGSAESEFAALRDALALKPW